MRHAMRYYRLRPGSFLLLSIVLLSLALSTTTHAVTSISQSYSTKEALPLGSIVSLENNTSDQVVAASSSRVDSLFGVVINANNSLLSLSNDQANQVQIATSGTAQLLVSDINGAISQGDHITASPISGVGMKATGNVRIIGIAQSDLTPTVSSKQSYTDKDGSKHEVTIGQIPALINVSYYFKEPDKTIIPSALQNIANSLAGRTVSTLPILIGAAIFLIMLMVVSSIIYSMIRNSIISVGRNPMSQSAVYRNLIYMSGLVLIILAVGLISIYLVLTKL